MILFKQKHKV